MYLEREKGAHLFGSVSGLDVQDQSMAWEVNGNENGMSATSLFRPTQNTLMMPAGST